jgi:hypothetical protein
LHELGLHGVEFGFLQLATDAKDEKTISMLFEIGAHGCLVWRYGKNSLGSGHEEHSDDGKKEQSHAESRSE